MAVDGSARCQRLSDVVGRASRTCARVARRPSERHPAGGSSLAGALSRARPRALLDRRVGLIPDATSACGTCLEHTLEAAPDGLFGRPALAASLSQSAGLRSRPALPPEREGEPGAGQSLAGPSRALRAIRHRAADERLARMRSSCGSRPASGSKTSSTTTPCVPSTRRRSRSGEPFEDLFGEEGTRAFIAWLEEPAPQGGAHGITRFVFYRVARARPDVTWSFPDLDGADGLEYVDWCWAFGRDELSIPDRFMPPEAGASVRSERCSRGASGLDACGFAKGGRPGIRPPAPPHLAAGDPRPLVAAQNGLTVRLTGYLGHTLGLGAAARGYVRALGAAGVPVQDGERAPPSPDAAGGARRRVRSAWL